MLQTASDIPILFLFFPHFCLLNQTGTPSYDIVTNFHTGVLLNLCKNHCPNTLTKIPEQMKRSIYQNTERVAPGSPITATNSATERYEQSFPGYEDDFLYFTGNYPLAVRSYVVPVRNAFDQLEYEGSFLFDRYPDREQLYRMADRFLPEGDTNRDLLLMLMLHEIMRRRERYRRKPQP